MADRKTFLFVALAVLIVGCTDKLAESRQKCIDFGEPSLRFPGDASWSLEAVSQTATLHRFHGYVDAPNSYGARGRLQVRCEVNPALQDPGAAVLRFVLDGDVVKGR